jgi:hypothetical protein
VTVERSEQFGSNWWTTTRSPSGGAHQQRPEDGVIRLLPLDERRAQIGAVGLREKRQPGPTR